MSKGSTSVDETLKFLNFFFNDREAILTLREVRGPQPTAGGRKIISETGLSDPLVTQGVDIVTSDSSKVFNLKVLMPEVSQPYFDALQEVEFNKSTPEAAATKMLGTWEQQLAELRAKR